MYMFSIQTIYQNRKIKYIMKKKNYGTTLWKSLHFGNRKKRK